MTFSAIQNKFHQIKVTFKNRSQWYKDEQYCILYLSLCTYNKHWNDILQNTQKVIFLLPAIYLFPLNWHFVSSIMCFIYHGWCMIANLLIPFIIRIWYKGNGSFGQQWYQLLNVEMSDTKYTVWVHSFIRINFRKFISMSQTSKWNETVDFSNFFCNRTWNHQRSSEPFKSHSDKILQSYRIYGSEKYDPFLKPPFGHSNTKRTMLLNWWYWYRFSLYVESILF